MERRVDRLHPGCFLPPTRREIAKGGGPGRNRAVSRQRTKVRQPVSLRPMTSLRQAFVLPVMRTRMHHKTQTVFLERAAASAVTAQRGERPNWVKRPVSRPPPR